MSSSNSRPLTFAICYGLVCGPLHGRRMSHLLTNNGYIESRDPANSDIIITHSAGCWLIPENAHPKIVLYIGAILGKPTATTWIRANIGNLQDYANLHNVLRGARVLGIEFFYAITQPRRSFRFLRIVRHAQVRPPSNAQVVFLANRADPWPKPEQLARLLKTKAWAFISLSGSHDNVWVHPDPYVDIINYYAK